MILAGFRHESEAFRLDKTSGRVDDRSMTKRQTASQTATKSVDKPKRQPARIRFLQLSGPKTSILPCEECGAHRYSIGTGTTKAVMFTPHQDTCSVPKKRFLPPERLQDYADRKAQFLRDYDSRIRR